MSIKNNMFAFLDGDEQGLSNLLDPVAEKKKIKEALEMEKKKQQLVGAKKKKPQQQQSSNGSNGPSTSTTAKPIAYKNHHGGNSWTGRTGTNGHRIQHYNNGGYQEKKPTPAAQEAKDVTMTLQEYEKKVLLEKKKALDAIITKHVSTKASSSSSSSNSPVVEKNNLDDDQDKKKPSTKMESTRVAKVKKTIAWGGHQDSVAVVTQGKGAGPANHRATNGGGYSNIVMRSFASAATNMSIEDPNQFPSLGLAASTTPRP